jgi:imidazolonepropionase-like amidohydrolase
LILIINANIYTMAGKNYKNGCILIENNIIKKVSEKIEIKEEYKILDVKGAFVMPGIIDAHCHIGIMEESMGFEGLDLNEATEPITPELRAIDAINPFDESFKRAIKAGITTVMTGPGSANVIGGQFCIIKTNGVCVDDMVVKEPAAIKAAFGENPKRIYKSRKKSPTTRMAIAALLRETLIKCKDYKYKRYKSEKNNEYFQKDLKMESILPVIDKKLPLKVHAHRADDILTAIRIAKEFDIKITLDHCTEAHFIGKYIKESGFPVIVGPSITSKSKIETKNRNNKTAVELNKIGIDFAIMTDHPVVPIEYLPISAGLMVREGLPIEAALKAITINPAKILGIDDKLGSIEEGKEADISIFNGNPMQTLTNTLCTIIGGKIIYNNF